jgi:hypothetical protein
MSPLSGLNIVIILMPPSSGLNIPGGCHHRNFIILIIARNSRPNLIITGKHYIQFTIFAFSMFFYHLLFLYFILHKGQIYILFMFILHFRCKQFFFRWSTSLGIMHRALTVSGWRQFFTSFLSFFLFPFSTLDEYFLHLTLANVMFSYSFFLFHLTLFICKSL